jgi:hypothetical protein
LNAGIIKLVLGEGDVALGHFERVMRFSPLDPAMGVFVAHVSSAVSGKPLALLTGYPSVL